MPPSKTKTAKLARYQSLTLTITLPDDPVIHPANHRSFDTAAFYAPAHCRPGWYWRVFYGRAWWRAVTRPERC